MAAECPHVRIVGNKQYQANEEDLAPISTSLTIDILSLQRVRASLKQMVAVYVRLATVPRGIPSRRYAQQRVLRKVQRVWKPLKQALLLQKRRAQQRKARMRFCCWNSWTR